MKEQKNSCGEFIKNINPRYVFIWIILLWALSFAFALYGTGTNNMEKYGQFGDLFGAINALFSGLALAGVVFSLLIQREELSLQRKEMRLTRKEMEDQKIALQEQQKVWEKQNFDSLFFSLFNTYTNMKESLSIRGTEGRPGFKGYEVFTFYKKRINDTKKYMDESLKDYEERRKTDTYNNFRFETYVKSLEQLLSTIFNAPKGLVDKDRYLKIISRSICKNEQLVLFYYGLDPELCELKTYIEQLSLLKDLPTTYSDFFQTSVLISFYLPEAYGLSSFHPDFQDAS